MNNLHRKIITMNTDINLMNRALTAYFRKMVVDGQLVLQPSHESAIESVGCRRYEVLRNVNGPLAVYRIRSCDQVLKRLKRWPKQFEQNVQRRAK